MPSFSSRRTRADSPVGLAAWLIDLGDGDAKPAAQTTAALRTPTKGQPREQLTRDDVLDNITLYWLTNTRVSSARWRSELKLECATRAPSTTRAVKSSIAH